MGRAPERVTCAERHVKNAGAAPLPPRPFTLAPSGSSGSGGGCDRRCG
jgi:hypothetical protein